MERDERVMVLGEDVGRSGGVFRATEGLQELFGEDRVVDTPLAESGIVGSSIGLAMFGMRPIAEIQFMGFIYPAFDQIISHAGRIRNRTRGRFGVPLVVRAPYGGGIHAPEHHSESTEAMPGPTPGDVFEYMYEEMPPALREQLATLTESIALPEEVEPGG
jgi:pyruvate dehydrogenase E1 component beta subunit